jgi:hypothetical protein
MRRVWPTGGSCAKSKQNSKTVSFAFSAAMINLLTSTRISSLPLQNEIANDAHNSTDNGVMLYGYRSDVHCRYTGLRTIIILLSVYFLVKK